MPDETQREALGRVLHDAVIEKARRESAHVAGWGDLSSFHREQFMREADAVIAAGWSNLAFETKESR